MFATAKTLTVKTAKGKAEKAAVQIIGLKTLAAIDAVVKSILAFKEAVEVTVKARMTDYFVEVGCAKGARPDNFKGVDGIASASCELRARSSRSPVSADELAVLKEYKISTEVISDVVETYVVNPEYAGRQDILALAGERLTGVEGIPEDFIMKQQGVSRTVVSDKALDEVFKHPPEIARMLLPIVGTLAVKPKIEGDSQAAFRIVEKEMEMAA